MSGPKISKMHARVNQTKEERQVRDALDKSPPPDPFWDEAQKFFEDSITNIDRTHGMLAAHLKAVMANPEERAQIADKEALIANVTALQKDVAKHVETLNQIHSRHEGRTGPIKNADDNMLLMTVHGEYRDATDVYNTITMPLVGEILEATGVTGNLVAQAIVQSLEQQQAVQEAKAQEERDPNVITDVLVKEVKKED